MLRNRRTLNLRFASGLALGIVVLGGSIHLVHAVQERRLATSLRTRAELAERREDLAQAETYLSRYLVTRPDDADAFARYALVLTRGATDDASRLRALEVLERAIGREPDRADLRRSAVDLAMLPALARYRSADGHLDKLLGAKPEDGELEELRGRCREALAREARDPQTELQEAEAWYAKAIAHAPHRVDAYVRRASLLRGPLAKTPRAEQTADSLMDARAETGGVVANNPKSAAAHLARARYNDAHKIAGADADVARALVLAPDDADVLLAAAEKARAAGNLEAARAHLRHGLEGPSGARDARLYEALAAIELQAGRRDQAAKDLGRGLEALPGNVTLLWDLADVLLGSGRVDDAEKLVQAELTKAPKFHPAALAFLEGRVAIARGRWVEAVPHLERARALAGTLPALTTLTTQADLLLADGHGRLGNPERQLAACRRVLAIDPASAPARRGQTTALLALGRDDDALEEYRKTPNPDSESRLVAARLLIARQARVPEPQRDWAEADRILGEVRQAEPESLELALLQAEEQSVRGQADLARATLEQARTKHPDEPGPWVGLIALAARSPKPEAALAVIDEARKALGDRVELRVILARYWMLRGGPEARRNLEALAGGIDAFKGEDRNRLLDGLADAFARSGDSDAAAKFWTRLAEARPGDPRVAALLFDLAMEAGPVDGPRVEQAVERLRRAEGPDGALWRYAEASRIVARARGGDKARLDEARRLLDEVAARRPEWSRVPLLAAEIAELDGQPEVAAEAYLQALDRGERQPTIVRRAVAILNSLGRFADTDRVIQKLTDRDEPVGTLAQVAAESSLRHRDQDRALELARRAVPADSKDYRDQLWLGRVYAATGRKAEAGRALARAVELAPEAPEAWVARVEHLVRTDAKTEAEDAIRQASAKLPTDRGPLALAACYELVGQPEKAEQQYKLLLSGRNVNAGVLRLAAEFYQRRGQDEKASVYLKRLLDPATRTPEPLVDWARRKAALGTALRGDYPAIKAALAELDGRLDGRTGITTIADRRVRALLLGKLPAAEGRREAIRAFEDLGRLSPPTSDEKYVLAHLYEAADDWPKARRLMLVALAEEPENPHYLSAFVRSLIRRGQVDEAQPFLDKLERLLPENGQTIELKARALVARDRGAEAVEMIRAYARTENAPTSTLAALLEELGQPVAAEGLYRDYIAKAKRPETGLVLAEFLGRQGRPSEALDICDTLWKTANPEVVGHSCLVIALGAPKGAKLENRVGDDLERALRDRPASASLLFDLANLRSYQGRYDDAEALLRRLVKILPGSGGPLNNLAWLLAAAQAKGDEALPIINQAIHQVGPQPDLLDTRGVVYLALGRADAAIKDLEAAVAAGPSAEKYVHLAQAYRSTKDDPAAREAIRKARAAGLNLSALHPLDRKMYERVVAGLDGQ